MSRSSLLGLLQRVTSILKSNISNGSRCYRRSLGTVANGQIRKAVQSDFDLVVAIDYDIYAGRDFLPFLYPAFIQNPNIHSFVYEINKNVVAFEAARVVDGGITIVTCGSRVKVEYKDANISKQFRDYIKEKLTSKYPIKFIASTTSNTSGLDSNPSFLKSNKEVLRRSVHMFPYQTSEIDVPEQDDFSATKVSQLTASQFCDIFQKQPLRQYLFPRDRLIVNAIPFRPLPENLELIQAENPFILMSDKVKSGPSPPCQGLVSMTTWFSYKDAICVDLEFYGCSNNFPEICNHIRQHLAHVRHLAPKGHVMVPHSYTISSDALLCAFSRFGLAPADSQLKTQYLFEESISKA